MKTFRLALLGVSIVSLLGLGACGMMAPAASTATALTARLAGASEVPAVATAATGMFEATLTQGSLLTWKVTHVGLSGPVTAAHFHGPVTAGENAGVVVPMTGPLTSPFTGTATLTPGQVADLTAGRWYVNLHTAANPAGEIRGQVSVLR